MKKYIFLVFVLSALGALAEDKDHATLVRDAQLYVTPGSSEKLVELQRGRDLVIFELINPTLSLALLRVEIC